MKKASKVTVKGQVLIPAISGSGTIIEHNATLAMGNPEFRQIEKLVNILWV